MYHCIAVCLVGNRRPAVRVIAGNQKVLQSVEYSATDEVGYLIVNIEYYKIANGIILAQVDEGHRCNRQKASRRPINLFRI